MEHTIGAPLRSILKTGASTLEMLLGTALSAMAFGLFILPGGFAAAGVTGLASVICAFLPLSLSQLVLAINLLFLALGLVFVGKGFTCFCRFFPRMGRSLLPVRWSAP